MEKKTEDRQHYFKNYRFKPSPFEAKANEV